MIELAFAVALARKPDLGPPAPDRCEPAALQALDGAADAVAAGLIAACPGMTPALRGWIEAWGAGEPSELAERVCPKGRADLRRPLSPGFDARMLGFAKACRIPRWDARQASGPDALLLGAQLAQRLAAGGVEAELADAVGRRVAGITGARPAGRYGSIASVADGMALPELRVARAPLPGGDVFGLDGARRPGDGPVVVLADASSSGVGLAELVDQVAGDGGAWVAGQPGEERRAATTEHAPVVGVRVRGAGPSALRLAVSEGAVTLALGASGVEREVEDLGSALASARERLSRAQEYAGAAEPPPDRAWVQPVGDVRVQRVLAVLESLLDAGGEPWFAEVALAVDGTLVEWPERVDGL